MEEADYSAAVAIMQHTVDALKSSGVEYKGILYGQFMLTRAGIMVVEYNCRFGDPEAMNVSHSSDLTSSSSQNRPLMGR